MKSSSLLLASAIAILPLTACKTPEVISGPPQQQLAAAREDLSQIPPPSKNVYLNIRNVDQWQNPLLTVQQNMIVINVLMPDANPSDLGRDTMLRPTAARKKVLQIRPADLAGALNAIPHEAWPYGRVVAIEEAHDAPASVRPALRRNVEQALQILSDIGVVADEWNDNRPQGLR